MDYLSQLNSNARLAIFLCLSLCAHLAILFALSWSSFGARQATHHEQHDKKPLTVILPGIQPATIQNNEKNIIEKTVTPDSTGADADTDKAGNKFSLSGKGIPLAIDQHYFGLDELDERPFVIQDIPSDPPELRNFAQGGKLILRLWINEDGEVIRAEPISSELPQAFIDSARNGFLKSRFAPGRIRGNTVGSVMDVVLHYAPAK